MLKDLRQTVINNLWESFRSSNAQMRIIENGLSRYGIMSPFPLDHFALIDLPGPHTGIPIMQQIFSLLGFVERGKGYLPDKQNEFLWMAEADAQEKLAHEALPQVVVADFHLEEMPNNIKTIIEKYSRQAIPAPLDQITTLVDRVSCGDTDALKKLSLLLSDYFRGRDWPLPTVREFETVRAFNELLASILVFGRKPNHFTLSIHLLDQFDDLNEFHHFIEHELALPLNKEGGKIKGGYEYMIAQGSTQAASQPVHLSDGFVTMPFSFVEFVWRYPHNPDLAPQLWGDYFTHFIAQHADYVIESVYAK